MLTEAWKAIAIREAIDHVWQLLRMAQQFPTVTLHTEVSAALRVTLPSVLLEQVLANIILNAAQAGATHLWIVAERTENGISIVLQDNAGGIDEALLRQAFQPFMTTRKEGMGLGLAIASGWCGMGGAISASGTRPRRTVCRERWSRYISYMNMGAGMATIHLLDDDTAVTNACAFLLESLGYDVKCWTQGADFLAQASLYQAGVVLLDMRMPVLDGQGVHDALRQCGSTLAVVFLTGHGDVPMAVEQMKRGAVDFLQKPVSVKPLQAALERALTVSSAAVARREIILCYQQLTPKERELASLVAKGL